MLVELVMKKKQDVGDPFRLLYTPTGVGPPVIRGTGRAAHDHAIRLPSRHSIQEQSRLASYDDMGSSSGHGPQSCNCAASLVALVSCARDAIASQTTMTSFDRQGR